MEPKTTIFVDFHFDAAHELRTLPAGHKCRAMHGHTYVGRLVFGGEKSEEHGWIVDFAEIKRALKPHLEEIDHAVLNNVPGLEVPTAENIALWFWRRLRPDFPGLVSVELREGVGQGAIVSGPGQV